MQIHFYEKRISSEIIIMCLFLKLRSNEYSVNHAVFKEIQLYSRKS